MSPVDRSAVAAGTSIPTPRRVPRRMAQADATSVVPTLVGLPAETAHNRALDCRLLAVDQNPTHKASSPGRVTAQMPSPGSELTVGERIRIWVEDAPDDGGGGGGGGQPAPVGPAPVAGAGAK